MTQPLAATEDGSAHARRAKPSVLAARGLPEVLAPAGDDAAFVAALDGGADAIYLGLRSLNARARAANFDAATLPDLVRRAHERGVHVYLTLNTLVFDDEIDALAAHVRVAAEAGVDALIMQDLGGVALARSVAPTLAIHASTQMTCTDAGSVEFAASLGVERVVLARELSLDDVRAIGRATRVPLEVFVHGALCVAYSGQCLTSEAIGGRSANRGACAQACRLPYDLVVDGKTRDTDGRAFLLSMEDLDASTHIGALAEAGVVSLKIEGRQKDAAYVAASTRLYRRAVDAEREPSLAADLPVARDHAALTYSRGAGTGFLDGPDHQRTVEGRTAEHRGVRLGSLLGIRTQRGRTWLEVELVRALHRGDGVMIEGGFGARGETGGRVWALEIGGREVDEAPAGARASAWLGPDAATPNARVGTRLWMTSDVASERALAAAPSHRERLELWLRGAIGERPVLEARSERGLRASVELDAALIRAERTPLDEARAREQLARLGSTPYVLGDFHFELPLDGLVPVSALNRGRRALVEALSRCAARTHATAPMGTAPALPDRAPPPGGLFVLCRTHEQARAARSAGADGVYLDFLELTGVGRSLATLRAEGAAFVGVAPPRIRRPGEERIDRYLEGLEPDATLVRGLGTLHEGRKGTGLRVGDFSLNVTNRRSAAIVLSRELDAFTPAHDLDASQLERFVEGPLAPFAEVVLHQPMPLFHTEHCVFAANLSDGHDFRTCGRPCERHEVALRDRAGLEHPVIADVGCRNTVFHARPQSGVSLVPKLLARGVRRFRVELVRETPEEAARIVTIHRRLLDGAVAPDHAFADLAGPDRRGVVRGSLRVL